MHGVERDDVAGNVEVFQKLLRRRDFVGFLVDLDMRQNQGRISGESAEYLLGPAVAKGVEAATKGLAVQRQHPPPVPFKFAACWRKAFSTLAGSSSLKIVRIEVCAGGRFQPIPNARFNRAR
jgi:hypothetical protein